MNRSVFISILLLGFSIQVHAQWISVEAAMGPGSSKTVQEIEDVSGVSVFGRSDGMDTIYIRNQYTYKEASQRRISNLYSINGFIKLNLPIKPRIIFSTGLGIESAFFKYRDVDEILDFEVKRDTLSHRPEGNVPILGGGGTGTGSRYYGTTQEGVECDTFIAAPIGRLTNGDYIYADRSSLVVGTRNTIANIILPLEFTYELIPNNLSLKLGAHFNFAIQKNQNFRDIIRDINRFHSTDSITVCSDYFSTIRNNDSNALASISITALARLELHLTKHIKAFASSSIPINSITKPNSDLTDSNFAFSYNYRPIMFKLGMSLDLFFSDKSEKKRTNYLLKSGLDEY